jgi:hypothetical protein
MPSLQLFTNNAVTTLAVGITNVATSLTLAAGTGARFPTIAGTDFFLITLYELSGTQEINHEIMKVTARAGDVLTVTRAQEGTTARAFLAGTAIELRFTAGQASLLTGLKVDASGRIGLLTPGAPSYDLDISGSLRVQSQGTSLFSGDTGSAALQVANVGVGHALELSQGGMVFSGTGQRIIGDYHNATQASRTLFQTSLADAATNVGAIPNGASQISAFTAFANSTPANCSIAQLYADGATNSARLVAGIIGTATYPPLEFWLSNSKKANFDNTGNFALGASAPSGKFHVQGGRSIFSAATEVYALQLNNADGSRTGPWLGSSAASTFVISSNGGATMFVVDGSGAGTRIQSDFNNATLAARTMFQAAAGGGSTSVAAAPNGAGTSAAYNVFSLADPTNASYGQLRVGTDTADVRVVSGKAGSGTLYPLKFCMDTTVVGSFATDGRLELAAKGIKSTVSSAAGGYATHRHLECWDTNGNTGQKNWALFSYKNGTHDLFGFMPLDDSGGTTTGAMWFDSSSAGTVVDIVLGAVTTFNDSKGTRSISYAHFLADIEAETVTAQTSVVAQFMGADSISFNDVTISSTSTTTHTVDFANQYHKVNLGHNIATLTLNEPPGPCVVQIEFIQDATGSRTVAWPASLKWPANVIGSDRVLSTAASSRDLLILRWNGTDYVANLIKGIA